MRFFAFFFDFFIFRFRGNAEEFSRARLILQFSLIEIGISFFYASVHGKMNFHVPQLLFIVFGVFLICTLFLFKLRTSLTAMAHIMIGSMWLGFLVGTAYSGGIYSLVLPWLALMPIVAHLLIDHRAAKLWALIAGLSICFFMFFFKNHLVMMDGRGDWRALVAHLGLVFAIFAFAGFYNRAKNKLLSDLQVVNDNLNAYQNEILA
jgi:hypothetical protein